jgi:hypothetical protein
MSGSGRLEFELKLRIFYSHSFVAIQSHPASTKLESTIFRPALSKSTVSLLPSTDATVPGPNFWWNTRMPAAKPDEALELATSSPSISVGPRRDLFALNPSVVEPCLMSSARLFARCQPGVE